MTDRTLISFRIRDKGGLSGGKTVSGDAPTFDLQRILKTPNADEFIKKAYFASVKKIIREIEEKKNGSVTSDLASFEAVVARSLSFTKDEIKDWLDSRDWNRANQVKDMSNLLPEIKKDLPKLASRKHPYPLEKAEELAYKVIAAVADDEDPVADFLFTILTTVRASDEDDLLSLL